MKKYIILAAGVLLMQYAQAQIDRTTPPKPGPAPVITIKDPYVYKMANGITVLVVEDHRLPKVTASLIIDAGPVTEGKKAGKLDMLSGMLSEGTQTMPKATFDDAVDKIGATVNLSWSGGSASALTRYFDKAFTLMGDALKEPAFPQESFDKLKTQAITGLKSNEKSAKAISERVVNALAYGKDNPAGEYETEETINGLTLQDVKDAYANYITPSRSYLTFIGDITPAEAKALATKVFGTWKGKALTLEVHPPAPNPGKTEIDVVDVPNAVQSEITVINLVDIKESSPDYFPSLLANYTLGGGAESRLFMNLREKHGFTYGAYSRIGSGRFQRSFTASASVRTPKTDSAVVEFLSEIKRIRTEKATDEELNIAKALYDGNFALGLEDPAKMATFASDILINNLPADFYRTYLQKVNAVTADDIEHAAQTYMNYDNTRIVIVGNASKFLDDLKKHGYDVKLFDAYANPVVAGAAAAMPTASATDIIKGYLDAAGGTVELSKITSVNATMTMSMQGMSLTASEKKMAPNKDVMSIAMGGNVVMKSVFDGKTGYQMQMGQKKDLTAEEIAQKAVFTSLTEQADYLKNPAFKLAVKGVQKINGADAYQIDVTDPTGKTSSEYYDAKSKLLVRNETTTVTNGNSVMQTSDLSDYRKVGNVMMPYKIDITASAGGQSQTFSLVVTDIKLNTGVTADDFK